MGHEFLAASHADVWVHCAGAPLLSTAYPDDDSLDAMEGEAAHYVIEIVLGSYKPESTSLIHASSLLGTKALNGIVITDEMIVAAQVMIDDVLKVCQQYGLLQQMHIEEKMMMPEIHPRNNGGTPDLWLYSPTLKKVWLWDFKFGHLDVPADSWQNVNYISGIKTRLGIDGYTDQLLEVQMNIVQPRSFSSSGPIKRFDCVASDLRPRFNQLIAQAEKAHLPDPGVVAGSHCTYCPARHECKSARQAAYSLADYAGTAIPEVMSNDGLSFELQLLASTIKQAQARYDASKEEAIRRVQKGEYIPGFGIENGVGQRKFIVPDSEVFMIGDMLGLELRTGGDFKVVTPAEYERRLVAKNKVMIEEGKEPIDGAVIKHYIDAPKTGIKLVKTDDSTVVKAFKQHTVN